MMGGYFDIEGALQEMLRSEGYDACAKPLPSGFGMPHVLVDEVGAREANAAQADYDVDFDVRCADYAQAARMQSELANWARGLAGRDIGGVPCYAAESRKQRIAPDLSHPTAALATVSATLRMRIAD